MRAILNVSIPEDRKKAILTRARKAKKTISAYILHAVELAESLIQEEELTAMAVKAEQDYKAGKSKKLSGLADLMK